MFSYFWLLYLLAFSFQLPLHIKGQETAATKYFQKKLNIQVKPFNPALAHNGNLLVSSADIFRDLIASTKYFQTQEYERNYQQNYKHVAASGKLQKQISPAVPFPCGLNNSRSPVTPSSVHKLRPGDIDIIGAMGDSLTAGTAMMANSLIQHPIEFRGQTILGGGVRDWRTALTIPNILKEFNPNLYGYAIANTLAKFRNARFNVAEPLAVMRDMPYMAEVLVKRMQTDPHVNMTHHWKMISLFVGGNDVCNDMCHYDTIERFLETHRQDLKRTLNILKQNIPRLMVNMIILPDLYELLHKFVKIPEQCRVFHKIGCFCLVGNSLDSTQRAQRQKAILQMQQIDIEVAALAEFQQEEFAVVSRTFSLNKSLRKLKNGATDLNIVAIDCFHFSQYGNAALTTMLWNEMLNIQPISQSDKFLRPFEGFGCPTADKPYISTLKNKN